MTAPATKTTEPAPLCDPAVAAVAESAPFAHVAVETGRGPHVTPVLYGLAGGRLWFVIPRGTLKAKVLQNRPGAGVLLRAAEHSAVLAGDVRLLDPLRPASWPGSLRELALAPFAAQSYSLRNPLELMGFALDGPRRRGQSMPPSLTLAALEVRRAAVVHGRVVERTWGDWPQSRSASASDARPLKRSRRLPEDLPGEVAALPERDGAAVLGWSTAAGPVALPAEWDSAAGLARVPDPLLELAGVDGDAPACVAFDAADSARPTGKRGLMLRGRGRLVEHSGARAVSVEPDRVTYWLGFETGTKAVAG